MQQVVKFQACVLFGFNARRKHPINHGPRHQAKLTRKQLSKTRFVTGKNTYNATTECTTVMNILRQQGTSPELMGQLIPIMCGHVHLGSPCTHSMGDTKQHMFFRQCIQVKAQHARQARLRTLLRLRQLQGRTSLFARPQFQQANPACNNPRHETQDNVDKYQLTPCNQLQKFPS